MPGNTTLRIWPSSGDTSIPPRHRRACEYRIFTPEPLGHLRPTISAELAGLLAEAQTAIHDLNGEAQPALVPLARLLLRTESIASSKIEGLQMGTRSLARAEAKAETGEKIAPTAADILANINAMELAVTEAVHAGTFTLDEVLAIHRSLLQHDPIGQSIAGQVRTTQNWVGGNDWTPFGADFVPPPADELPVLLDDLCSAINDDSLAPLMQAGLVHAQFETLHPFADGNGRTGRALIQVVLRRRGLTQDYVPPISVVLARRRDRYIDGLTSFRGPDALPWLELFVSAALEAAALARRYLRAVHQLQDEWRARLSAASNPRKGAVAWELINELPGMPMVTTPVASARLKRAKSSVHQAVDDLVAAGVLAPVRNTQRNRVWEAVGLLELLEGLESGRVPVSPEGRPIGRESSRNA